MKILWLGLEQNIGREALILNKNNFSIDKVINFNPDIVIEREFNATGLDWSNEIILIKKSLPNVRTATWLIDTHVREPFHKEYCKLFDYAFFAISRFMDRIDHPRKFWLPVCHTSMFLLEFPKKRPYHIGFVGRFSGKFLEERSEFMFMLKDIFPDFHLITDYGTVYQTMSKIEYMVNLSYDGDMNFRTFESLACGCGLITNDVPDLHKITGLDERITIFDSFDSCVDAIKNKVGVTQTDNSKWVMEKHTLGNRFDSIINMIQTGKQEEF